MRPEDFLSIGQQIVEGKVLRAEELLGLSKATERLILYLMAGANLIRQHFFGDEVHLCTIQNAKSGRCPEDCAFCSQSSHAQTDAPIYDFVGKEGILKAIWDLPPQIHRFSVVTSGRRLSRRHVEELAEAYSKVSKKGLGLCASLGSLGKEDLQLLKEAGLTRYHHNIETAPSFFPRICTTHSFQERVDTIRNAKELGLQVCSGGIFGMGETDEQIVEMILVLRELDVDAVPCNFLTPIKGTKLGDLNGPNPLRCLKIIGLLRFGLPNKEIIICGGREQNLKELHPLIFYAGASGIMTGNYLTTKGRSYRQDLDLIEQLNFSLRRTG